MGWVRVGGSSCSAEGSDAQVIIFMVTLLISFTDHAVCYDGVTVFTSHATHNNFNFSYDLGLPRSLKQVD